MIQDKKENYKSILLITPELKKILNETRLVLKGSERRKFMAKIVKQAQAVNAEQSVNWAGTARQ